MTDTKLLDSIVHGRVDPYIYAFETNTVPNFLKVGDTYRPVEVRLDEWRNVYSDLSKKYEHIAKVDEHTYFRDYSVHDFLTRNGFCRIERSDIPPGVYFSNEFFRGAKKENVQEAIRDIQSSFEKKENRYDFYDADERLPLGDFDFPRDADWKPRENQQEVIEHFRTAVNAGRTNLLLFAVMRFGKSFTSLCCAKAMDARLVVIVCGKTAVRSEWKETVQRPKLLEGFCFVDSGSLKKNPSAVSEALSRGNRVAVFLTMQDLLGDDIKKRHADVFRLNAQHKLDLLIIDETHFGARAEEFGKTLGNPSDKKISRMEKASGYDESFDELESNIKIFSPKVKLHLSGTPYRILLDNEFEDGDIVGTVQYSDIIDAKEKWDRENIEKDEWENPYYGFPQMVRFAFNLNQSATKKLAALKNNGYDYDLNELLSPKSTSKDDAEHSRFKYENEVLDLLRAIDGTKNDANIFSFLNYDKIEKGKMCRHIVMVLPFCASCDAMEVLLKSHSFNKLNGYEIINIAGFDSDKLCRTADYASRVKEKIAQFEADGKKTISLTVGKMLTGCTVKEWDTMIFLRNTASPQDYDQATFRLQSQYVKTMTSGTDGGKIIRYDMKPQTLLVDFDPLRMYTVQHKKSLIANIHKSERGNENLEDTLRRELEIAPIISMNCDRLQKVEAKDIVDSIRSYNAKKSMMDETLDIEIDSRIFDDEEIKLMLLKQPEVTGRGVKFELSPYRSDDEETQTDVETPPVQQADFENSRGEKNGIPDRPQNEDERKTLASRLQGYYFKLLLFAFLSETEEKTLSDIIEHIETDADGKRIGGHLQINVSDLRLFREKIHPAILSCLENKIHNIHQLGTEITPDTIGIALRKLSRLSVSEVVTPPAVARELAESLPPEITANSRILDIASKTGEFAGVLLQKYGNAIKNNIYSIPTSGVTYECTRKIYRLLGLPAEHIYSGFTSYDIIDKTKNEKLLKELADMKFDAIVGNPPYQEEGINNGRKQPLYYLFMNKSFELSKIGALITPARFLFNAGETPKEWNKKMLNDEHFSVIKYYSNSNDVFPAVEIKGGIALSIRNENAVLKKIDIFTAYDELNNILQKVNKYEKDKNRMESIVSSQGVCRFTAELFEDFPQIEKYAGEGTGDKILSKVVETGTEVFSDKKFQDAVEILAKGKSARIRRFIKAKYIQKNEFIDSYNVLVPESNGNGAFETFSSPEIAQPNEAFADTFLAVGSFSTKEEAENCMKYIKTKFARALLGVLKVTQHNPKSTWKYVPLQDFTANSDIDWSKPIAAIDRQLYKKYNLDATEIAFIEKNVREME